MKRGATGSVSPDREVGGTDVALLRQAQQQTTLYEFTDRLFRARTLGEIHEAALDAICGALGCPRASVLCFDHEGVARFVAWRGLSEGYRKAVDGHSPWKPEERDAKPIFIEDIEKSGEARPLVETILSEGIHALGFIPLAGTRALIGKFMVYYDTPRVFQEHEREIALVIARQLGFAIERYAAEASAHRLTALVESSQDAIVAKDLDGIITDWNSGAERLFGYSREEIIGQSVTLLIPEDRPDEEPSILARIRAGERVEHYETIRKHKDGSLLDISLTISPIRDSTGQVVGASKIARDITDWRRAQQQRELLLREMNHRVKNLFAVVGGIVNLSASRAPDARALASAVSERLAALSRAHSLTMSAAILGRSERAAASLHALIGEILSPYREEDGAQPRFSITGIDVPVPASMVTPLALLLHEFATNAVKYGSLSVAEGRVEIACAERGDDFAIVWRESGGPPPKAVGSEGFGSLLVKASAIQLGRLDKSWDTTGLVIELLIERSRFDA
ncbi:PAS domain S-box protein [Bosea thiooxidans]